MLWYKPVSSAFYAPVSTQPPPTFHPTMTTPLIQCNPKENPLSQIPIIRVRVLKGKTLETWLTRVLKSRDRSNVFYEQNDGDFLQVFGFEQELATRHTLFTIVIENPQSILLYREIQPVFYAPSTNSIGWDFIFRSEALLLTKDSGKINLRNWSVNARPVLFQSSQKEKGATLQTCQCIDFINGPWEMWTSNCLSYDWGCLIDCGLNTCFWCAGFCSACASTGSFCGSCIACALGCGWCGTRCCTSWWSGCIDCGAP